MFDVEMVVFSALNLFHPIKAHWLMHLSYNISIFYVALIALTVPITILVVNRPIEDLQEPRYMKNWGIVYKDYRLRNRFARFFKCFSILRFLFFGLILVFAYYIPLIQISGSFMIAIVYLVVLVVIRPHNENIEFFMEFITEMLFTIGNFFFLVLALDESYNIVKVDTRVNIGWFIVVIYVLALAISILLVLYPALKIILRFCRKAKKVKEDSQEEEEAEENKREGEENTNNNNQENLENSRLNTSQRKIATES